MPGVAAAPGHVVERGPPLRLVCSPSSSLRIACSKCIAVRHGGGWCALYRTAFLAACAALGGQAITREGPVQYDVDKCPRSFGHALIICK